jgi:hypothetical protein
VAEVLLENNHGAIFSKALAAIGLEVVASLVSPQNRQAFGTQRESVFFSWRGVSKQCRFYVEVKNLETSIR